MSGSTIVSIEWGCLEGNRPRKAGSNARLGEHGIRVSVPMVRIRTQDGASGFGLCRANREQSSHLLGNTFESVFSPEQGVQEPALAFDYPLWDLAGNRAEKSVRTLAMQITGAAAATRERVPCYDTSLYFDDLHLDSNEEAAALLAAEAREGYERGHRAFKIKVGRGARHMELEKGMQRDVAIVRSVREVIGPTGTILLDANNGWNLNLTCRVLDETAEYNIHWIEEPFHEDPILYRELRAWMDRRGLTTLIADGEGHAAPPLLEWAREGWVNVIQFDIFGHGFTRWLQTGSQLDAWGVRSAPHHYGLLYGNYVSCHLAGPLRGFTFTEWDEAQAPGLHASGYLLAEGALTVPDTPGFGLSLDETIFQDAVRSSGWAVNL